jgi:esterase/lipase superfamily enzyme
MPLPTLWRFQLEANPDKHFVLKNITRLTNDRARLELSTALAANNTRSILLFIHGYNVSFRDAAFRSALLAHDLAFPGVPLFFSWPSAGTALGYWRDEEMSVLSESALNDLINEINSLGATEVYLIAHSMGNRIAANVLHDRVARQEPVDFVRELLLAAPDVNEEIFRDKIVPTMALLAKTGRKIYASDSDAALRASKVVHQFRRLGQAGEGLFVHPSFETIDATDAAPMLRAFGHSYVVDSARVLQDIREIILFQRAADNRGLAKTGSLPTQYWRFP